MGSVSQRMDQNQSVNVLIFVWVVALRPSQHFFSHVGPFSWFEQVLSNGDEVSCSRTQHCAPGENRTCKCKHKNADQLCFQT